MVSCSVLLLIVSSFVISVMPQQLPLPAFTPKARTLSHPNYSVTWEVDMAKKEVTFEVTAATQGFVGFGISDTGTMVSADILVGGFRSSSSAPYSMDMWATGMITPTEDAIKNWVLESAIESNGKTTLRFGRAFVTNDTVQDIPIQDKNTFFIWSFGSTDNFQYHGPSNRGKFQVNILNADAVDNTKGNSVIITTNLLLVTVMTFLAYSLN